MKLLAKERNLVRIAVLATAIVGTFVLATAVSRHFFERPSQALSPRHPQNAMVPSTVNQFRVAAIEGPVEAFHNGGWYVVQAGDQLSLQDVLRTPLGSRAILRRDGVEIEVQENVDIRLESLAASTATLDLLRGGRVVASVAKDSEQLQITSAGARTKSAGAARWIVTADREGRVSVAVSKGRVGFAAGGKEVPVAAGQESTAQPGQSPSDPEAIPEELLLSVVWPELEKSETRTEIAGKVSPSSEVRINGVEVRVDASGKFSAPVDLRVGSNRIAVQAEDTSGRKKSVNRVIDREPPQPTLEMTADELWKR